MYILKNLQDTTRYKKVVITNEQYNDLRINLKQFYKYIAPRDIPLHYLKTLSITKEAIKLFHEPLKLTWYVRPKKQT